VRVSSLQKALERIALNIQVDWKLVEAFENAMLKAQRNDTCLYPGCTEKSIGSHVIARKTLRLIAENSKVLTWPMPDAYAMFKQAKEGKPMRDLTLAPELVGIHDIRKVTHPIFCQKHDREIFVPIEKDEIASRSAFLPEQIVLLAYRALCSVTYNDTLTEALVSLVKKHDVAHPLHDPERFKRLLRFKARDILLKAQQSYEQIHLTQDYQQLGWSVYPMNVQPCVAATYSHIPNDGNSNDAQSIVDGTLALAAEDVVHFTLLPDPRFGNSICIISWLKDSPRARQFMLLSEINELSEQKQQELFSILAFRSPTIYISPTWWRSLSDEKREEYAKIHQQAGREHAQLV
jgi:hypothetical protein